jgi:hypothetical protein
LVHPKTDVKNPKKRYNFWWALIVFREEFKTITTKNSKIPIKWFIWGCTAMPCHQFPKNDKPPRPPNPASLTGGLDVRSIMVATQKRKK